MINILRYGDQALLINFEQKIEEKINEQVIELKVAIEQKDLKGFRYLIPAYCSLTLAYNPFLTDFDTLEKEIHEIALGMSHANVKRTSRNLIVPVCYDKGYALDFEEVMEQTGFSREKIIELHTQHKFRVFMLGFMPGFTYMGKLPPSLFCKRKKTPRLKVPGGSVGLAGFQTGIYPSELPGGWQIIGRTPLPLFDPYAEKPFLFQAGDRVGFTSISPGEYEKLAEQIAAGTWNHTQMIE